MSRVIAEFRIGLLFGSLLIGACGGGGDSAPPTTTSPPPPPPAVTTASFAGIVTDEERETVPVVGARVSIGSVSAVTGQDGRFDLPNAPIGNPRVTISLTGYDTLSREVSIKAGNNYKPFLLPPVNTFYPSNSALVYVPPGVTTFRGAIYVMYGGTADSRPMLMGDLDFYLNLPPSGDVSGYRTELRNFARTQGFAVVGMLTSAATGSGATIATDIAQALAFAASGSKHPELVNAPLLLQGMSNGACIINRVVVAVPSQIIGFISMKSSCPFLLAEASPVLSVPGYVFLGELDTPVDIQAITADFEQQRARGAVWALAVERGVAHVWPANHALIFDWARAVVAQRLPATVTPGAPVALRPVGESSGWLGDRTSFLVAGFPCFTGNKQKASWLPTEKAARDWQVMAMGSASTVTACP